MMPALRWRILRPVASAWRFLRKVLRKVHKRPDPRRRRKGKQASQACRPSRSYYKTLQKERRTKGLRAMATAKHPTKLAVFTDNVNTQVESPLFSVLPPELRWEIFRLALTPYADKDDVYPFMSYYYRENSHVAGRKVDLALLSTCRRIWNEAVEKVGFPTVSCDDETFYWGWFERRPNSHRFETVGNGMESRWATSPDWSEGESEEDEEEFDEDDEEEEEEEVEGIVEGEEEDDVVYDGESHLEEEEDHQNYDAQTIQHFLLDDSEIPVVPVQGGGNPLEQDDISDSGSVVEDEELEEVDEVINTSVGIEHDSQNRTPWQSSSTDHPFQLWRCRHYQPYHWAAIKTITIFPQLFSFSTNTFSQFFQREPNLRPTTVRVVIRYTDWWSWEHNKPLDIKIGMSPGFAGRVILPDSVSTFIMELETREGKKDDLEKIVRDMQRNRKAWKWGRTDGGWLELSSGAPKESSWMGPTMFFDENIGDDDNYYRNYRFPHHPEAQKMKYLIKTLTWKFAGSYAANVEQGQSTPFETALRGVRGDVRATGLPKAEPQLGAGNPKKRSFEDYDSELAKAASSSKANKRVLE